MAVAADVDLADDRPVGAHGADAGLPDLGAAVRSSSSRAGPSSDWFARRGVRHHDHRMLSGQKGVIGDVAAGTADPAEARPATRPLAALRSGRFHRVIALLLVALSALILLVEVARHHAPTEIALLLALLAAIALARAVAAARPARPPHELSIPVRNDGLRLTIGASDAERQPR